MRKAKNNYRVPLNEEDIIKPKREIPPHTYSQKLRHAVDFLCKVGKPIFAAASGKVVWIKDYSKVGGKDKKKYWNLGNRIVIKHRFGEYTAYEHLKYKGAVIKVGQRVKNGQLISFSGNTGWNTIGPHLHFEVFINPIKDESEGQTIPFSFKNN